MLWRFCLYGFLKNQRYFEPFFVLVLLDKGLDFTRIGLLWGFRELVVNLFEVPSGSFADVHGRRASMIASFVAYAVSFALFGAAQHLGWLFAAMFFFAIGESFRSGTHKSMIFTWLRTQGRLAERTRIYGLTRSWSQLGSALSGLLAAVFVLVSDGYHYVFYLSIVPALLNIVNFLGYPREVDGASVERVSVRRMAAHTWAALGDCLRRSSLRRLILESASFEGMFDAAKDYLQPVLKAAAVGAAGLLVATASLSEAQQSALLVGPVYFVLHLGSSAASRQAHRLCERLGHEDHAATVAWRICAALYLVVLASAWWSWSALLILGFVGLHVLQSLWRPILISRFDAHSRENQGATILSIESQSQRVATMILAPLLGVLVDWTWASGIGVWPVGLAGLLLAAPFALRRAPARPAAAR